MAGKPRKPRPFRGFSYKGANERVEVDGIKFQSKREAGRWVLLRDRQLKREIFFLQRQVKFRLEVDGVHITDYIADFVYYTTLGGSRVVEDVKGFVTDAYEMKRRLMRAVHKITIQEV